MDELYENWCNCLAGGDFKRWEEPVLADILVSNPDFMLIIGAVFGGKPPNQPGVIDLGLTIETSQWGQP